MSIRPNVILIVFDTARADALEPYGAGIGASPSVTDLASRGWAAKNFFSTSNWTLPSHASMFTGMMPREMGMGVFPNPPQDVMNMWHDRMLAPVLSKAGYDTFAVSANPWISRGRGFDAGFERFQLVRDTRRSVPDQGMKKRIKWVIESVLARLDDGMATIESTVNAWLDEVNKPFFGFVNLMECHSPYLPPRPYNDLSARERLRAASEVQRYTWHRGALDVTLGRLTVPPASMARLRHLYARAVRSMDDWLGRLMESLDKRKLLDDTTIVVTSDHGENLGEQGLLGHGISLTDRLIRVPLVMAGPSIPKAPSIANLTAVPRLISEAIGLEEHPWEGDDAPADVVVAESDGMKAIGVDALAQVIESWDLDAAAEKDIVELSRCLSDGRFKLLRKAGVDRLFDLDNDPLELTDVAVALPEVRERMRLALDDAVRREDVKVSALVAPSDAAAPDPGEDVADLEQRMRALGYL